MKLTASDIYSYYRPSECGLRIALKQMDVEESPPGPYAEALEHLGQEHEKEHLATFKTFVDLSSGTIEDRFEQTKLEIKKQTTVIYHGLLKAKIVINGVDCEVIGEPDFLIAGVDEPFIIRDSKISRRINEKDHPEINHQMNLYGWLYEHVFGISPSKLQVHSGTGEIIDIPYDSGSKVLGLLEEILRFKQAASEFYSPVGWSKCSDCGFYSHCWPQAKTQKNVAMVSGVDQGLAFALREQDVKTIDELLASFDEESLSEFKRPAGKRLQRVGKKAKSILRMAQAMASEKEIILQAPDIPDCPNYVMFDLEGLPPQLDEAGKIYLWGMQVFGSKPSEYIAATAGFKIEGDKQGWEDFLNKASSIFDKYGDIPFVHWHRYEKDHIKKYIERFEDIGGVAERILSNLLDLLPITQESIALPLPSYSLKVVEQYIGFERSQVEYGGDWAMAKYIEATEMLDEQKRSEVMDEILRYNQEDLEATWAVLQWLKTKC